MKHKSTKYEYSPVGNSRSKSGYAGISWNNKTEKWIAQISFYGQSIHLGSFPRLLDAFDARERAEEFYGAMRKIHKPSERFTEK